MATIELQREAMDSTDGGGEVGTYQVLIIGGGPGGLTAGLYASRAGLKTLMLERQMTGGQVATTDLIENYPGAPEGTSGPDLMATIEEQARRFGLRLDSGDVLAISQEDDLKVVHTDQGDFRAKTVIVSTGSHPAKLGVPGEDEYRSRGVSYCATCDGFFFRNKVIAVIGGGDSAVQEAIYLSRFATKVHLIHRRDALRATNILQERAFAQPKISFLWDKDVVSIEGGSLVERIVLRDTRTGEVEAVPVDGVFVYVGQRPNTAFLEGLVELDPQGYVVTDEEMRTNVPGIFAAGDVRRKALRQMITAASDGAIAANSADLFIEGLAR